MKLQPLEKDAYFHLFNRGINGTRIFTSDENKRYFLQLLEKHLSGKVAVLAYCLMDNHFHFAIRILADDKTANQTFSNLFNAYAKAFNKQEGRTGTLFERPFKRKRIENEDYLRNVIMYIHINPENHGVVSDFRTFKFSSYPSFKQKKSNVVSVELEEVIALFDDLPNLEYAHRMQLGDSIPDVDLSGFENLTGLAPLAPDVQIKDKFYTYI
ncbi:MAG: transposase, partial [Bacteroidota bacterium]